MSDIYHSNLELTKLSVSIIAKKLSLAIAHTETKISDERKAEYLERLASYQHKNELIKVIQQCYDVLTNTDIRYLLCFAIEMEYTDIVKLFHVERSSIYTVRYRIRKKLKSYGGAVALLL